MKRIGLGLLGLILSLNVWAGAQHQDLAILKSLAVDFLKREIGNTVAGELSVNAGHLDPRLTLARCPSDKLTTYLPPGAEPRLSSIVGVRCDSTTPWSIYVPVKVNIYAKVVKARRPLHRNQRLTKDDVIYGKADISRLSNGYYRNIKTIDGFVAKRAIIAGKVLTPHDVASPKLVKRGDMIKITAIVGNAQISMQGVALVDGRLGDTINVRNKKSSRELQARVVGPKLVNVAP